MHLHRRLRNVFINNADEYCLIAYVHRLKARRLQIQSRRRVKCGRAVLQFRRIEAWSNIFTVGSKRDTRSDDSASEKVQTQGCARRVINFPPDAPVARLNEELKKKKRKSKKRIKEARRKGRIVQAETLLVLANRQENSAGPSTRYRWACREFVFIPKFPICL